MKQRRHRPGDVIFTGAPCLNRDVRMRPEVENSLRSYLLELVVYGVLVVGYYFLVLHFLAGWLHRLFTGERGIYAAVALGLIIAQGLVLETLTRWLLAWFRPRTEDE